MLGLQAVRSSLIALFDHHSKPLALDGPGNQAPMLGTTHAGRHASFGCKKPTACVLSSSSTFTRIPPPFSMSWSDDAERSKSSLLGSPWLAILLVSLVAARGSLR